MKGGSTGPWAMQKINSILYPANMEEVTWAGFVLELDEMFADPNHQATAWRKLATLCQGNSSVKELWIVHTVVIELVLLCPRVTREKPHPERLRNPLQQSPHPQSMSCLRTPLTPSTSRSSSPPSPCSHPSPHLCS